LEGKLTWRKLSENCTWLGATSSTGDSSKNSKEKDPKGKNPKARTSKRGIHKTGPEEKKKYVTAYTKKGGEFTQHFQKKKK